MTSTVQAVYEQGVFRPLTPLALPEGQQVEVIIVSGPRAGGQTAVVQLAEIAALPVEGSGGPFTSRDHDRVLYGEQD